MNLPPFAEFVMARLWDAHNRLGVRKIVCSRGYADDFKILTSYVNDRIVLLTAAEMRGEEYFPNLLNPRRPAIAVEIDESLSGHACSACAEMRSVPDPTGDVYAGSLRTGTSFVFQARPPRTDREFVVPEPIPAAFEWRKVHSLDLADAELRVMARMGQGFICGVEPSFPAATVTGRVRNADSPHVSNTPKGLVGDCKDTLHPETQP